MRSCSAADASNINRSKCMCVVTLGAMRTREECIGIIVVTDRLPPSVNSNELSRPDHRHPGHPAVLESDWWKGDLGETAEIVPSPSKLMRRSRFENADFTIDNSDVLGVAVTCNEHYSTVLWIDGSYAKSTSRVGEFALLAPGQRTEVRLTGNARFLLLGISVPKMIASLSSDTETDFSSLSFETVLAQRDPHLERALFRLAGASEEEAYEATLAVIGRIVLQHSAKTQPNIVKQNGCLTPTRLRRVADIVEENLSSRLSLPVLASAAGVSPFHFAREFRIATGYAPHQYVIRRRADRAMHLLATTKLSISEIANHVGFYRGSHLARYMRNIWGLSPTELRRIL